MEKNEKDLNNQKQMKSTNNKESNIGIIYVNLIIIKNQTMIQKYLKI